MSPNRIIIYVSYCFLIGILHWSSMLSAHEGRAEYRRPNEVPTPEGNMLTQERIALGKLLFFDPRLSASNLTSCATCHKPELGWSDGLPKARNELNEELDRATPGLVNVAYQRHFTWDGRFRSLEEQALMPIVSPMEMNQDLNDLSKELANISAYQALFAEAYPNEKINKFTIAKALASFQRTLISGVAPFDRWVDGDEKAISESAKRGFDLFEGKANCVACHSGFNFTDGGFHNIGLPGDTDLGRFRQVPVNVLKGAFKTPTLRGITHTAPYMHNGAYKNLQEVIEHYNRGGVAKEHLDASIRPLFLSDEEKRDLIELLKTFTATRSVFVEPEIP